MKRLTPPALDAGEVLAKCIADISNDSDLATRFVNTKEIIFSLATHYQERSVTNQLHLFPASKWGHGEQSVLGVATKSQFNELYSKYMVPPIRQARVFYDRILNSAPLGKCPLCGFGQVSTLDHFMAKAYYPYFSVLPINLIPVCADCNRQKKPTKLETHTQSSHPYFEISEIETETWLYAHVVESSPATAIFSVVFPSDWSKDLCVRVRNHFNSLDLASRFAIEAASEMATISDYLGSLGTSELISEYLGELAQCERRSRKNSWRAALYEALSQSTWYQYGGYQRPSDQV